ncbi:MAG TPA: MerR family transcriptional regulator [Lactobacillaceae bacterium]|jgi:DNA-binding transcriptional MerR regulator
MNVHEVAKVVDLTVDAVKYYEKMGMIAPVPRNDNGYRNYGQPQINQLIFVKKLRRGGLRIDTIKKYMALYIADRVGTHDERRALLHKEYRLLTEKINELNETREVLADKLQNYYRVENLEDTLLIDEKGEK